MKSKLRCRNNRRCLEASLGEWLDEGDGNGMPSAEHDPVTADEQVAQV